MSLPGRKMGWPHQDLRQVVCVSPVVIGGSAWQPQNSGEPTHKPPCVASLAPVAAGPACALQPSCLTPQPCSRVESEILPGSELSSKQLWLPPSILLTGLYRCSEWDCDSLQVSSRTCLFHVQENQAEQPIKPLLVLNPSFLLVLTKSIQLHPTSRFKHPHPHRMMALVSSSTSALPVQEINQDITNKNREIPKNSLIKLHHA